MEYRPEDFIALQGLELIVAGAEPALALRIDATVALPVSIRPGGGFVVTLTGPAASPLGQGIVELLHGADRHEIFIVPVKIVGERMMYEAVFN